MTDYDALFRKIAKNDLEHQTLVDAGLVLLADQRAYEALRAELIAAVDKERGTTDVTYAQFREAFDHGANCQALFELRNRMHPKDPLKDDANQDLRSVDCYAPSSTRRE